MSAPDVPVPEPEPEVKAPFSFRCWLGSFVATLFWPAVILTSLALIGTCANWQINHDTQKRLSRTREQRIEQERVADAAWESFKHVVAPILGVVVLLGGGFIFVGVSDSYYEKCHSYWTKSPDPTWREAMKKMFEDNTPKPDPVLVAVHVFTKLDLAQRELFLTKLDTVPPPEDDPVSHEAEC